MNGSDVIAVLKFEACSDQRGPAYKRSVPVFNSLLPRMEGMDTRAIGMARLRYWRAETAPVAGLFYSDEATGQQ